MGSTCATRVDGDFTLLFSSSGKLDYVAREGLRGRDLNAATLCAWLKTPDRDNYGTPFSYATDTEDNALTLTDYSGFVVNVNGEKRVTDVTANDGRWHLICLTWASDGGTWSLRADGELRDGGTGLAAGTFIPSGGTVVLGQEQDSRGGDFSNAESYVGYLYGVELWDSVLSDDLLANMTSVCDTAIGGNVLTWADFKYGLRGGIRVEESPFCKGCMDPLPPTDGEVDVVDDASASRIARYQCRSGYRLSHGSPQRRCLVHGGWSGPDPQCRRVDCGFPGYVLNGLVHGSSYAFNDVVTYNCTRGFVLVGQKRRTCGPDGSWSDEPPECQPVTCPPPPPLFNGSLADGSDAAESYAVGDRVAFQCQSGFRLEGPASLTCTDDGQWDDINPLCQPLACTHPPYVQHGVVTNGIAEIPAEDLPAYLTPGLFAVNVFAIKA